METKGFPVPPFATVAGLPTATRVQQPDDEMLTQQQIDQHLATLTYKPGWTFTTQDTIEGPQLRIRCDLEDSYQPGTTTELGINTYIPPIPNTQYLEHWLLYRLARIEIHETQEWLKRNGRVLFDPHAEEQP